MRSPKVHSKILALFLLCPTGVHSTTTELGARGPRRMPPLLCSRGRALRCTIGSQVERHGVGPDRR